jgi:hypothetical protein
MCPERIVSPGDGGVKGRLPCVATNQEISIRSGDYGSSGMIELNEESYIPVS